ncbi:hypothetical protein GCM10008933_12100 [Paenibacillus motobuensis]|uniref:Uncharacterized protein n=1 Tax=Paenibacillus motobuensis TaxID=295324 RepID=A0ABN0Y416_9BACL
MKIWGRSKERNEKLKPSCYRENEDPYPLCKGAKHPQEFAENDCLRCNLYEEMVLDD